MTEFLKQYIETALWSSTDGDGDGDDTPLDHNYNPADLAPETLVRFAADCERFQSENAIAIAEACEATGMDSTDVAHDFWLTRNGHGCGFWDGDWPEPQASQLDNAARSFGEIDLYVGDDGQVYC